jgi:ADP-heptose:LPS heptosyltransferase
MFRILLLDALTILALPFLLFISWWRRRHPNPERRMLIIQLGKIGDMVCTTPLFRALHEADPTCAITIMCLSGPAEIIKENPYLSGILALHEDRFSGLRGRITLCGRLLRDRYNVTVCVLPGTFNALLGLWSCAPKKLHVTGGRIGPIGKFFHLFFTDRLSYERGTRTYDHYMNIAKKLGAAPTPYKHEIFLTDAEQQAADEWMEQKKITGKRYAILSLTAGNVLKEWPLDRFIEVARFLLEKYNMMVLFSSSDMDRTMRARMMLGSEQGIDAGGLPLRVLAGVIKRASLFISVDTGPLYIAHAFGVPLIDIVGPVDPKEQPPMESERVVLVLPPSDIHPTSFVAETLRVSNEEQRRALDAIKVEDLQKAIQKLMHVS